MYVVLAGKVDVFGKPPVDDDHAVVVDWPTVKRQLHAVQASLAAIKSLANVTRVSDLVAVRKPDTALPDTTDARSRTSSTNSNASGAGAEGEEAPPPFDPRRTWGRVFGGIRLAAMVANAAEELERAQVKRPAVKGDPTHVGTLARGDSFGESCLLDRRPSESIPLPLSIPRNPSLPPLPILPPHSFGPRAATVRPTSAVCRRQCTLLFLDRDAYMSLAERNLLFCTIPLTRACV